MEDRTPPQDIEAEMTVLGAVLKDGDAYRVAKAILEPVDFRREAHRTIFSAMDELNKGGSPIDLITLKNALRGKGHLEDVGGASYLSKILTATPTADHVRHHAKIVKEKSTLRKLILLGHEMISKAHQEGEAGHEVGHRAIAAISQIAQGSNSAKVSNMASTMVSTITGLEEYAGTDRTTLGVPTGLGDYDQIVGGFYPGDLIVIAARPAVGKTSLLCSMAYHQAKMLDRSVAVFSLEQPREELSKKFIAYLKRTIDIQQFRTGPISDGLWEKVTGAAKSLSGLPIYIEDCTRQTVFQVADRARILAAEKQIEVIYIDHLQLLRPHRKDPLYVITGEQTRELKALARELKIPVVLMAQVSRDVERRTDKRPQLSELRWSGDIEQDADIVTFIHRPDMYSGGGAGEPVVDAELIVKKNRHGPTGTVVAKFVKRTTHFVQNYIYGDYEAGAE